MSGDDELRVERGRKPAQRLEAQKWGQLHLFSQVVPIDTYIALYFHRTTSVFFLA